MGEFTKGMLKSAVMWWEMTMTVTVTVTHESTQEYSTCVHKSTLKG